MVQTRLNANNQEYRYKSNTAWGDPMNMKDDNTLRVYYQNVNGIGAGNRFLEASEIAHAMNRWELDVMCASETNVEWNHRGCKEIIKRWFDDYNGRCHMNPATSTIRFEKYYKPGGVAQIVVGDVVGRIRENGTDENGMGRYAIHELQGRRGSRLVIITAYRVTNATANGPETTYTQQVAIMRENGVPTPNPRRQILVDLQKIGLQ
jgi:hypothetical protein